MKEWSILSQMELLLKVLLEASFEHLLASKREASSGDSSWQWRQLPDALEPLASKTDTILSVSGSEL